MTRVLFAFVFTALAGTAAADSLRIGVGAGFAPDYEGSDEYTVVPLPSFEYETDIVTVETSRLGLAADVVMARGVDAGPILRWDMGRSDVDDAVVDLLADVDGALEIGGYVGLSRPIVTFDDGAPLMATARVEVTQGVGGGHEGLKADVSVGLVKPFADFTVGLSGNMASSTDRYMDAYFSVDAADAARSGLATYDADGGLRSVGLSAFASYKLTESWSLNGFGAYTLLVGDAADSPIVDVRGDANQFFVGFGVSYQVF